MYKTAKFVNAYAQEKDSHPFRIHMERYTILKTIKNLKDLSILDVACGSGSYSRLFCEQGAKHVVGVDYSEKMIETAWKTTPANLPIEYIQVNGLSFRSSTKFDLVFHSFFLNYAARCVRIVVASFDHSPSLAEGYSRGVLYGSLQ